MFSLADKFTTETQSFVWVIANYVAPLTKWITKFSEQVRMGLSSQLIKDIFPKIT